VQAHCLSSRPSISQGQRGAFTGAQFRKKGKFEAADGNTICLDEISDISLRTHADRPVTRAAGEREPPLDYCKMPEPGRSYIGHSPTHTKENPLTSITSIIEQLEHQRNAIDKALAALREVGGISTPATAAPVKRATTPEAPVVKRKKFSLAARRRMALAQKARYAKLKGDNEPPSPVTTEPPKKRKISPEGLKRIIAATKKRWRLKRAAEAAALGTEATPKKVAVKKAAPVKQALAKKKSKAAKKSSPAPIVLQSAG
jgi:hypothetical protein